MKSSVDKCFSPEAIFEGYFGMELFELDYCKMKVVVNACPVYVHVA